MQGESANPATEERRFRRLAFTLLGALAVGVVAGVLVPAGLGWDFANFYDAGRKVLSGQVRDLYIATAPIGGQAPQGTMEFLSTPLCALLCAPLGWLAPLPALAVFKLIGSAAMLAGLWLLYRHSLEWAELENRWRFTALYLLLALLWQPFWTVYRVGGQTMPVVFLLFVLALVWRMRGGEAGPAICLAFAVVLKPAFAPGLLLLAVFWGWRFAAALTLIGALLAGFSIWLFGWQIHAEFLSYGLRGRYVTWVYNSALTAPVENLRLLWQPGVTTGLTMPSALKGALWAVRAGALGVLVWLALRARPAGSAAARHYLFLLALVAALALSPVVWEHYLALLFIPAAYLLAWHHKLGLAGKALLGAIAACAAGQNIMFTLWLAQHFQFNSAFALVGIGLWKCAPLLLLMLLLVWKRGQVIELYASATRQPGN